MLTPETVPLQWGTTQHLLRFARVIQGEIEHDTKYTERAVTAFHKSSSRRARDWVPRLNGQRRRPAMAEALLNISKTETGRPHIDEAIVALKETLKVRSEDSMPFAWAETQMLLAEAHYLLATRTRLCDDVQRGRSSGEAAMSAKTDAPTVSQRRATKL